MPIEEFTIQGTSSTPVIHRTVRAKLYASAEECRIDIAPLNNTKENSVRVIIDGDSANFEDFYKQILDYCRDQLALPKESITTPVAYAGAPPDWERVWASFEREQLTRGIVDVVDHLQLISKGNDQIVQLISKGNDQVVAQLGSIGGQLSEALVRFDTINQGITEVKDRTLPEIAEEISKLRGVLEKLVEKMERQ